jgi:hypothetical protein
MPANAPGIIIPQVDTGWLDKLTSGVGAAIQPHQGSGYFPPAPGQGNAGTSTGSFFQRLIGQIPQNQFSVNPLLPGANVRPGG